MVAQGGHYIIMLFHVHITLYIVYIIMFFLLCFQVNIFIVLLHCILYPYLCFETKNNS